MARHWWLVEGGNWFECQTSGFMECAFDNTGYFGLTEEDRRFMLSTTHVDHGQQIHAFLDKMLRPANSMFPKESGANAILAQWVDADKRFIVAFWVEDHQVYSRVMSWLSALHITDPDQKVLMKEWSSQRQWVTTSKQILSGGQFSKNPDRAVTCNRCGANIGKEEVVARGICPKCGMDLVGPM